MKLTLGFTSPFVRKVRITAAVKGLSSSIELVTKESDEETYLQIRRMNPLNKIPTLMLDNGQVLLVNRGFLPLSMDIPQAPTGRITIEGRLRMSAVRRTGAVSDPSTGELQETQRIDIDRLAPQLPNDPVAMYVELLDSQPADSDLLSRISDPVFTNGPHLSYAVQWFLFSGCAIAGWLIAIRREVKRQRVK